MSRQKIMSPGEIRVELARRRMTRVQLAAVLGVSHDYVVKIINGQRTAAERRAQITEFFKNNNQIKDMRGIS